MRCIAYNYTAYVTLLSLPIRNFGRTSKSLRFASMYGLNKSVEKAPTCLTLLSCFTGHKFDKTAA